MNDMQNVAAFDNATPLADIAPIPMAAPHNIEAEQALLGAILINNEVFHAVSETVEARHFYDSLHAKTFDIVRAIITSGRAATPVTLQDYFGDNERIDEHLTIREYIGRLATSAAGYVHARDYAATIVDLAARRDLIAISQDMAADAARTTEDRSASTIIEQAECDLYKIADVGTAKPKQRQFAANASDAMDEIFAVHEKGAGLNGLSTGIRDLDRRLGGLRAGQLIVIGGRPGMGKSALAVNIAFHLAAGRMKSADHGAVVQFFSMEMTGQELAHRLIAQAAGISGMPLATGNATPEQVNSAAHACKRIADLPLFIDQTGGLSISQIANRARRTKRQFGTGLIIVDYLQLMAGDGWGNSNRVQEITKITTGLKTLAKELDTPIIALSQLSRNVENRPDKRPHMADLRESGSIEQDADIVILLYREEYYAEQEQPDPGDAVAYLDWQDRMAECQGKAEIIIGKHRHAKTGIVPVAFNGEITTFSDLARGYS